MAYGAMIPSGDFNIEDDIARHSRMSMALPDRAKADRAFANSQADLVKGAEEAKTKGDKFAEQDYNLRHNYAEVMRSASASQDNYNRFRNDGQKSEATDAWEHRELYRGRLEEIRESHEKLRSQASSAGTNRDFNSIDEAPGEDRAKKAVWDQNKLRADGEAAQGRGDNATKTDCALRWNYANAQAAGDTETLAKIRTEHETFRERAAKSGRDFNHIDQPRGEDAPRKAAWEQGRLWKQKEEFGRAAETAKQNGDRWDMADCQLRIGMAGAKLRQDAGKVQQIESTHKTFQARTESETGRKFNDLSQPRGEDAARKAAWEQGQGQQSRAAQPQAEPLRDAAREAPQRPRTEAPGFQRRAEKGQAARMQDATRAEVAPAQSKPTGEKTPPKLDAVVAKARTRAQQGTATGQAEAPQASQTAGLKTRAQLAEARQTAEPEKAESTKKEGAVTASGRARYLKRQGADAPEFIKLASQDRNFGHAKQFYDARPKGFDSLRAKSKELAAQQSNQSQEERPKPPTR